MFQDVDHSKPRHALFFCYQSFIALFPGTCPHMQLVSKEIWEIGELQQVPDHFLFLSFYPKKRLLERVYRVGHLKCLPLLRWPAPLRVWQQPVTCLHLTVWLLFCLTNLFSSSDIHKSSSWTSCLPLSTSAASFTYTFTLMSHLDRSPKHFMCAIPLLP